MKRKWFLLSGLLFMLGCGSPEVERSKIVVLGHGGAGFPTINNHYQPNSEESIKQALLLQGADGVEVDVQMTRDRVLVLFHNRFLEEGTNGTGFVSEKTWEELSDLTFDRVSTTLNARQRIWRLSDLVDFILENDMKVWLSLNIKPQKEVEDQNVYNARFGRTMSRTLAGYSDMFRVIVESPELENLKAFYNVQGRGGLLMYVETISQANVDAVNAHGFNGIVANYLEEDETSMTRAQTADLIVALYGAKIRQDILPALNLEPTFIQTDNVPLTLSCLD